MICAITGGAGFIGSNLARRLDKEGHRIVIADNLSTGSLSSISGIPSAKFCNVDVRNRESLAEALAGVDRIFHLAALTSVEKSYEMEQEYVEVNVSGTENVLYIAEKYGTKVVFASSSSVYGNTDVVPTPENAKRVPANPYGATKIKAELAAESYYNRIDVVGLRYYNVYGKDMLDSGAGVISRFYQDITHGRNPTVRGDGTQLRDFVFIDDVIDATVSAMEKNTGSLFLNIGSGMAVKIIDLAYLFIKHSKKDLVPDLVPEKEGDVRASQADISLAGRVLGYTPQTKLEEWVEELYKQ